MKTVVSDDNQVTRAEPHQQPGIARQTANMVNLGSQRESQVAVGRPERGCQSPLVPAGSEDSKLPSVKTARSRLEVGPFGSWLMCSSTVVLHDLSCVNCAVPGHGRQA